VNIYHIESVQEKNNHIIFFNIIFFKGRLILGVYIPIYPRRYAPGNRPTNTHTHTPTNKQTNRTNYNTLRRSLA